MSEKTRREKTLMFILEPNAHFPTIPQSSKSLTTTKAITVIGSVHTNYNIMNISSSLLHYDCGDETTQSRPEKAMFSESDKSKCEISELQSSEDL